MASLHAFTNSSVSLATLQVPTNNRHINELNRNHKWTFLVANKIRFSEKPAYCIRIVKPEQNCLSLWLEKIVTGGQCSKLFVENLSLDEINFKRLKQQCLDYRVTLVNLMPNKKIKGKVVKGPW
jgi:hypothetical protein